MMIYALILASVISVAFFKLAAPRNRIAISIIAKVKLYCILILHHLRETFKSLSSANHELKTKTRREVVVSGLFVYPVKSLRAIDLSANGEVASAKIDEYGLKHDRRLMVVRPLPLPNKGFFISSVEATHRFVSQRIAPSLTQIIPSLPSSDGIIVLRLASNKIDEKGGHSKQITARSTTTAIKESRCNTVSINISPKAISTYPQYLAGIWDDVVTVADVGDDAAKFVQDVLKSHETEGQEEGGEFSDVRVVVIPPNYTRLADEKFIPLEAFRSIGKVPSVMLADGFPILIASEASLTELNRRLQNNGKPTISMSQFRPNIVITGNDPFEEDTWKTIIIGDNIFHVVKGCARCKQSCTNQLTGDVCEEPIATLSEFRALGGNKEDVFFCQNAVPQRTSGTISIGDTVKILKKGTPIFE